MKVQVTLFLALFVFSLVIGGIVVKPVLINNDNDLRIRVNNIANAEAENRITSEIVSELIEIAGKTDNAEIAGSAFFNAGKMLLLEYKREKENNKPSRITLDNAIANFERAVEICIDYENSNLCNAKLKKESQIYLDYAMSLFKKSVNIENMKAQDMPGGTEEDNRDNISRMPIDSSVRGSKSEDHEPSRDGDYERSNPGSGYNERPVKP